MLIGERLKAVMKSNGLSSGEFADSLNVKRSNMSHVLNGRNKPGLDFLSKVIKKYPNVNASWLITGEIRHEGEEPKSDKSKSKLIDTNDSEIDKIIIFYTNGSFKSYDPNEE